MSKNRVNVKTILANVVRDMQLDNVSYIYDSMIEWAAEAEAFIGSYEAYERKECLLDVSNYKAQLPCGFYKLISLKIGEYYPEVTNRDFRLFYKDNENLARREAGGIYKFSLDNNYAHFSNYKSGKVGIAYLSVPLDEEGFPLILSGHEPAITAYVMWKLKIVDFINGNIPANIYQALESRWYFLCGQARGNDTMPNSKEMEYISAVWQQLVPPPTQLDIEGRPSFKNKY